jgi:hypothetical protein
VPDAPVAAGQVRGALGGRRVTDNVLLVATAGSQMLHALGDRTLLEAHRDMKVRGETIHIA